MREFLEMKNGGQGGNRTHSPRRDWIYSPAQLSNFAAVPNAEDIGIEPCPFRPRQISSLDVHR